MYYEVKQYPYEHGVIRMLNVSRSAHTGSERVELEKAVRNHLQGTKVHFQAMSNKNGVCTDEAQQGLLHLAKGGVVTFHIVLTDAWKPLCHKGTLVIEEQDFDIVLARQ